jgi:hypothetical protein
MLKVWKYVEMVQLAEMYVKISLQRNYKWHLMERPFGTNFMTMKAEK